jgi:hypothetical protein
VATTARPRELNRSTASQPFDGFLFMKTLALILVFSGVGFGQSKPCRPVRHAKLPAIVELTYPRARRKLLAAGWRPLKTNAAATDLNVAYGNGPFFWRRGYTEIESCSGTGVAACAFLFKDRFGNRLRVTTEGEELPEDNAHAHVNGSRFVCD